MSQATFAITAYQETGRARDYGQRILECLRAAQEHDAIDEIVVVDDGSDDFPALKDLLAGQPKVNLFRNKENRGVFGNKLEAIALAVNDTVVTCDSDNVMDSDYITRAILTSGARGGWVCPSFARPEFDYRHLVGEWSLGNILEILDKPLVQCLLNTGNQTVRHDEFMDVFSRYRGQRADLMMPNWLGTPEGDREKNHWRLVFDALDSFIFNYVWLLADGRLHVVPGLEYSHRFGSCETSNYTRSPPEKTRLGEILFELLREDAVCLS